MCASAINAALETPGAGVGMLKKILCLWWISSNPSIISRCAARNMLRRLVLKLLYKWLDHWYFSSDVYKCKHSRTAPKFYLITLRVCSSNQHAELYLLRTFPVLGCLWLKAFVVFETEIVFAFDITLELV